MEQFWLRTIASTFYRRSDQAAGSFIVAAPLSEGKPVITTLVNANAAVKDILRALKSTSILLIPIMVAGKNWGHIGLNDGTPHREWTAAEIEPLLALATLFGVTIEGAVK